MAVLALLGILYMVGIQLGLYYFLAHEIVSPNYSDLRPGTKRVYAFLWVVGCVFWLPVCIAFLVWYFGGRYKGQ